MIIGQQTFDQGHQESQGFAPAPGHRSTSTDTSAQELQVPRVLHPTSLIHQQPQEALNNMAPDPSIDM